MYMYSRYELQAPSLLTKKNSILKSDFLAPGHQLPNGQCLPGCLDKREPKRNF